MTVYRYSSCIRGILSPVSAISRLTLTTPLPCHRSFTWRRLKLPGRLFNAISHLHSNPCCD